MKYIAAPYASATDKAERMSIVTRYSASCLKQGQHIICPLTMGHNFSQHVDLPQASEWWLDWCFSLLGACSEIDVLMLDGWDTSIGVTAEIKFANENNIKINYIKA